MLEVSDIHTYYGDNYVLQGLSLRVKPGQVVAVLGRNGVGKTTLVRSIIGATPPRRGSITLNGVEIARKQPYQIARAGIALVPQGRRIFRSLSVRENLELGIRTSVTAGADAWTLDRIFQSFPILAERGNQAGTSLSGGEQQMLACARAILSNPQLLLMDEPSEGLAPQKVRELGEVIARIRGTGLSMLLVEQKLPFALKLADHVYVLSRGIVVYDGDATTLASDRDAQERYLGVAPT
ncbi:MAG: ABC transporter ATP-binding protein [Pseudorhodoplanes sp.]